MDAPRSTPSSRPGVEVVVVGAGPTGLTLACELLRRGVSCRILDCRSAPDERSRCTEIHGVTLEILGKMGVAERLLERGRVIRGFSFHAGGRRLLRCGFEHDDGPYPAALGLPQYDAELVLDGLCSELGGVVERSVKAISVRQDPDGVTTEVLGSDGRIREIRSSWLVGCDGAHSTIRRELGLTFDGKTSGGRYAVADVEVQWDFADDESHVLLLDRGFMLFQPLPTKGRVRLLAGLHDGVEGEMRAATFQRLADEQTTSGLVLSDVHWMSGFRVHRRLVSRLRTGRVFLAGDAAHICSPVLARGMNLGVQDAHNLAWKLALVARNDAGESLLESYHAERHRVAAGHLAATDRATRALMLRSGILRRGRNAVMKLCRFPVAQRRLLDQTYERDVSYPSSRSAGGDRPRLGRLRGLPIAGARAPDVVWNGGNGHSAVRMSELVGGINHTLLLFNGDPRRSTAEREATDDIRRWVRVRYPRLVNVIDVVTHRDGDPVTSMRAGVIADRSGAAHGRYAATDGAIVVIRPDGYIGYRSALMRRDDLRDYLGAVFR